VLCSPQEAAESAVNISHSRLFTVAERSISASQKMADAWSLVFLVQVTQMMNQNQGRVDLGYGVL
jgi:hypothetical protein